MKKSVMSLVIALAIFALLVTACSPSSNPCPWRTCCPG
jgi:hypothetical protein